MKSTRVLVLGDYEDALGPRLRTLLEREGVSVDNITEVIQDDADLIHRLAGCQVAVVIRERTPLSARVLKESGVEFVVTTGSNTSVIDLEAGIPVSATRSMAGAAAELTWALILAVARNIENETGRLRTGQWQGYVGTALEGKRLGVLGLGRIGGRVAKIGQAFGMEVVAWSRSLTQDKATEQGVTAVGKDELFETSDVISLHLRLGDASRGIIDESALRMMKRSALLINTSRAQLIEEDAAVRALQAGQLGGFGQDVFLEEPLPQDSPLRDLPRTVLTPHLGYVTDRNMDLFANDTAEDIRAFYAGEKLRALNW